MGKRQPFSSLARWLRPRIAGFADRGRRFAAHRGGATVVMFAVSIVPVALAAGAALDFVAAHRVQTQLDDTADGAVLAVVARNALGLTTSAAKAAAESYFKNAAAKQNVSGVTVSATVVDVAGVRNASITYSGIVPTSLMNIAGISTVTIGGGAKASAAAPIYTDFYLLLDNTPSMGIGATPVDVDKMVKNTPDQCGFACHDLSAKGNDYYSLAKSLGVTMRIDVVRQATQQLMDTAKGTALVPTQFRAGIYTMGQSCQNTGFYQVSALSTDLAAAKTNAAAIDLMTIPYQGYNNDQCSDFNTVLAGMSAAIPAAGDGSTPLLPQKVLFLVSDGVADSYNPGACTKPTSGGRCQEPLNPATCMLLKARGVRIAVLYTTYLPLPTNGWYNQWISPFQTGIGTQMQACASPGLYFEVSPTQGIADAMTALFQRTIQQTRLTQ